MVDVMHYKVIKRQDIADQNTVVYLLESDGGRYFTTTIAPEDIDLKVGDVLQHNTGNIWLTKEGKRVRFSVYLECTGMAEAEEKFKSLITG
ncbi:hypothetical protein SMZ18_000810 [Cronobacter dublinensis]|nr:hypothetical protein [Cronobacter dublinensis]